MSPLRCSYLNGRTLHFQLRQDTIRAALADKVDEYHGVKVYLGLDKKQRLDVQLISNTNIAVSRDLFDRLQETFYGPELRNWCQACGLLDSGQDFADVYERGGPISVKLARTLITNYFLGTKIDPKQFDTKETIPIVCPTGGPDPAWDKLKTEKPTMWSDPGLLQAGKEFAALAKAQRDAFLKSANKGKARPKIDYPEKAFNVAIISAWAYVAGMLHGSAPRLKRHFALRAVTGKDPLNAAALGRGRHKSDPPTYRGLGYRMDAQERGRFVELFYLQAEDGHGITPSSIDIAIQQYHIKQARLDLAKTKAKTKAP
jgi:hypothetical protein